MSDMPEVIWVTPLGGVSGSPKRGDNFQSYTRTDLVDDLAKQLDERDAENREYWKVLFAIKEVLDGYQSDKEKVASIVAALQDSEVTE